MLVSRRTVLPVARDRADVSVVRIHSPHARIGRVSDVKVLSGWVQGNAARIVQIGVGGVGRVVVPGHARARHRGDGPGELADPADPVVAGIGNVKVPTRIYGDGARSREPRAGCGDVVAVVPGSAGTCDCGRDSRLGYHPHLVVPVVAYVEVVAAIEGQTRRESEQGAGRCPIVAAGSCVAQATSDHRAHELQWRSEERSKEAGRGRAR